SIFYLLFLYKRKEFKFKTTKEIKVSNLIIDQIIGQEQAIKLLKKISKQRRHLLLIGAPGTGKSLIAQALSELLSKEKLQDILSFKNSADENIPIIKTYPKGKGIDLVNKSRIQSMSSMRWQSIIFFILAILAVMSPWWIRKEYGDIMAAASLISSMVFLIGLALFVNLNRRMSLNTKEGMPKSLIDNSKSTNAPFIDATGAHSGALFGDVLHDPLQSGGLGTPPHERLIPGMIHRANKGVLFIDEVASLKPQSQQDLLTALQEKKFSITGQSERSSGAMTRSGPVPCDFILVASGNPETLKHMHPALRSRIRGYGYEIYMDVDMDDNEKNRYDIARFVAQEVVKDRKIPHFTKEAVIEIINEARKRSGRFGKLTLKLRELGGLIRAAGDIAFEENSKFVLPKHITQAKQLAKTLEQQIADKYIEQKKEYQVITTKGKIIGKVNGLAVLGTDNYYSG
ncbi:MAG: ATP-dependent protease LonB, partial [Nanoarchaeota archaeon]